MNGLNVCLNGFCPHAVLAGVTLKFQVFTIIKAYVVLKQHSFGSMLIYIKILQSNFVLNLIAAQRQKPEHIRDVRELLGELDSLGG